MAKDKSKKLIKLLRHGKRDLFLTAESIKHAKQASKSLMVEADVVIEEKGPEGLFGDGSGLDNIMGLMQFRASILTATLLYTEKLNELICKEPTQFGVDIVELCHREIGDRFHEISKSRAEQRSRRNDS